MIEYKAEYFVDLPEIPRTWGRNYKVLERGIRFVVGSRQVCVGPTLSMLKLCCVKRVPQESSLERVMSET